MKAPAQIKKEMGMRLQEAREKAGYASAEEFCSQNAIDLTEYLEHESGQRGIKASDAKHYARLLKVSLDWLIIGEEI